jgi:hypothetical protein
MRSSIALATLIVLGFVACNRTRSDTATTSTKPSGAPHPPQPVETRTVPSDAATAQRAWSWNFDADTAGAAPSRFSFGRTGNGRQGVWTVRAEATAPSAPNALAQQDADSTNFRFPIAVAAEPRLKDVRVSVKCRLVAGNVDRACGLVARYQSQNDYLITRANALENNVRLYTVIEGKRRELASFDTEVSTGAWHDYSFELRGDQLQVFWNGKRVIDHRDGALLQPGLVGVWTKADSLTYFDDLSAHAL